MICWSEYFDFLNMIMQLLSLINNTIKQNRAPGIIFNHNIPIIFQTNENVLQERAIFNASSSTLTLLKKLELSLFDTLLHINVDLR